MRTLLLLLTLQAYSWAAIAFVQATNNGHTSSTTSPTVSITPTVGNTVIVALVGAQQSAYTISSCTDNQTPANTYVIDVQKQNVSSTNVAVTLVHSKITTASGAVAITCTATAASFFFNVAGEFSGLGTLTVDGTDSADTVSTTYNCGSVTPTSGKNEVLVSVIATSYTGGAFALTAAGSPGTYIIPAATANGGCGSCGATASNSNGGPFAVGGLEYQIVTSTSGAYTPQFTAASNVNGSCATAAYQAAATTTKVVHRVTSQ